MGIGIFSFSKNKTQFRDRPHTPAAAAPRTVTTLHTPPSQLIAFSSQPPVARRLHFLRVHAVVKCPRILQPLEASGESHGATTWQRRNWNSLRNFGFEIFGYDACGIGQVAWLVSQVDQAAPQAYCRLMPRWIGGIGCKLAQEAKDSVL